MTCDPSAARRAEIRQLRQGDNPTRWREIAARYRPVPAGTLARFAYDETYEPRRLDYRRALGLPELPPVRVRVQPCGHCGGVHLRKTCPAKKSERRPREPRLTVKIADLEAALKASAVMGAKFVMGAKI